MADITLHWDIANSRGDIAFKNGDVVTGNDLATSVLVSIFSDRLANADDVIPDNTTDRRGWWGDDASSENGKIGSRLWLLDRAKQLNSVLQAARDYESEGLEWMKEDGIAADIDILCEWTRPSMMGSLITVTKPDGQLVSLDFDWAWKQIDAR